MDSFLEPIEPSQLQQDPITEPFCMGFFLSSFPYKKAKVIENSLGFPATCGHEICSKLPAMQPEIIFKYPIKDTKELELNNLTASICFPTGIKVCFDDEKEPFAMNNYVTPITTQNGTRLYMTTYHFYVKYGIDYNNKYEMHPLKHLLNKFTSNYTDLTDIDKETTKLIQDNLKLCEDLGFKDYIYVPYCLSLISKYPYILQMEKILQIIFKMLSEEGLNEFIPFIIDGIYLPDKNSMIKMYLPYCDVPIELNYLKASLINLNMRSLLNLNVDHILLIFRILLFEKKILFFDDNYENLSVILDAFLGIIYPFEWVHTFIPIMSDQMIKYLETFLPFINGIHISLEDLANETLKDISDDDERVYLFYLKGNESKFSLSGKKTNFNKYVKNYLPNIPYKYEKEIKYKFKNIQNEFLDYSKRTNLLYAQSKELREFDNKIHKIFMDVFLDMFSDYTKYISFIDDDVVFNKNLFISSKTNEEKNFFLELFETQIFQQFIQNFNNENSYYFNSKLNERNNNNKIIEVKKNQNEKTFIIKPEFLNLSCNNEANIEKELYIKYNINSYKTFPNGILKCNFRIIEEKNLKINTNFKASKIYKIPYEKNNIRSSITIDFKNKKQNKKYEIENLNEKEIENTKEKIKIFLSKVFKSEISKNFEKNKEYTEFLTLLKKIFSMDFFINLICQNKNEKELEKNSFDILVKIFKEILINYLNLPENDKIFENIINLLRNGFLYKTKKKKQNLFEELVQNLTKYSKFTKENFWFKWYEMEIKENIDKINININIINDIIYNIVKIMLKIKIEKNVIIQFIKPINNFYIKERDIKKIEECEKNYIKIINSTKY